MLFRHLHRGHQIHVLCSEGRTVSECNCEEEVVKEEPAVNVIAEDEVVKDEPVKKSPYPTNLSTSPTTYLRTNAMHYILVPM